MRRVIEFGKRVILAECEEKRCDLVFESFLGLLERFRREISKIMDDYKIPNQIILMFKVGNGDLQGMYRVHSEDISKHLIVIDIYTRHFFVYGTEEDLLETFIHEIVHHRIKSEKKTIEETYKIMRKIIC